MAGIARSLEKLARTLSNPLIKTGEFADAKTVRINGDEEVKEDLNGKHVVLQDIVGAITYLNCCPASLKLSKLTNCKIICGPVHTTILVEYCRNCVFFLCGKQVRVCSSEYIDMYVRVQSRSTIEDSKNIRFAPYVWDDERSPTMSSLKHFDVTLERFDLIEDYNWLAFSSPSPNWTTVPEKERSEFPEALLPERDDDDSTAEGSSSREQQDEEIQFAEEKPILKGVFPA